LGYEIGYIAYVGSGGDLREIIPMPDGSVLVGGHTSSTELPTTEGVIQPDYAGDDPALGHPGIYGGDCYLVQLSRDGKEILAATYFGGSKQERSIYGMALDKQGNIIITSATRSPDIPTTMGCFQPEYGGGDSDWFVAKISPDFREVLWCTYVGGSKGESPRGGLTLDEQDNVYVVGGTSSSDFPTTPGSFQPERNGTQDSALIKLEPDGTKLTYSTLIGGSGKDPTIVGAQVDVSGDAYGAGHTQSADFPVTADAPQPELGGKSDCFFTKFSSDGSKLVYSTYLGGSENEFAEHRLYLASDGSVILTGVTSSPDFPTTEDALQRSLKGRTDGFITKLSADGKRFIFSTLLGGSGGEFWLMPTLDSAGNILIVGQTDSQDFPTTPDAIQPTYGGGRSDGAFAVISPDGSKLLYATYLGGSSFEIVRSLALGHNGEVYVIGSTGSRDFLAGANVVQPEVRGTGDAFVVKLIPKH
jgi:Tol biopolymer transport system component